MDFFERQDKARRNTKLLVVYFIVAVVLIILSVYLVTLFAFVGFNLRHQRIAYDESAPAQLSLWDPKLFFGVAIGTLAVISLGSMWKTAQLAGGGKAVAESLDGRLVLPDSTDPNERKLLNVVEEMAIAAGLPVPPVYVMDDEPGINAFAAGHSPADAVVSVTRGCMTMLSRDELQGVIGHEFSHILNGDMRLNLRLMGIIFGILCIATIGRVLFYTRSNNSRDRNALPLFGLLLIAIGAIGVLFGRLIQAAVSRQREFLADASSVQFTRNPLGLSGALQKIGRYGFGSRLESPHAADASHMFFGNGVRESLFGFMATHPPIRDRIHAIDPTWDGTFPLLKPEQIEVIKRAAVADLRSSPLPGILGVLGTALGTETISRPQPPIPQNSILPNLGKPTVLHLRYAEQLRDSLPDSVKSAAREPAGATALVYALLLSSDAATRATQMNQLSAKAAPAIGAKIIELAPDVAAIAAHARLPLVNLALAGLRTMQPAEYRDFTQNLKWLIESDGKVELFEYVLQKIVARNLDPHFSQARQPVIQYYSIKPLVPDGALLLSALAQVGSNNPTEVQKAFAAGAPYLRCADVQAQLQPIAECGLDKIDGALNRLSLAAPQIKKNVIEACIHVVGADGVIVESEAELLRAVADTLDCPIPPFVTTE